MSPQPSSSRSAATHDGFSFGWAELIGVKSQQLIKIAGENFVAITFGDGLIGWSMCSAPANLLLV
jgi:hypothetical protein